MNSENADNVRRDRPKGKAADDASKDAPRDPVTGTTAKGGGASSHRSSQKKDPDEIQEDIRRTRADMSETVDALEHRLSPERLKNEAKGAVHETIDEVRYRYNPQRLANRAKRSMLETVREHPLPALTAGLSIGYLLMKGGESKHRRDYDDDYRRRRYGSHPGRYDSPSYYRDSPSHYREMDYESEAYRRAQGYAGREQPGDRDFSRGRSGGAAEGAKRRASETAERAQDTAQEAGQRVREGAEKVGQRVEETAREAGQRVQEGARETRHQIQYGARRASSELEDFVTGNPLAAGAVAVGIGALLGGMFPSTRTEDEWMGRTRDEAAHRAAEATRETMSQARESAEHVGERAAQAADEVKQTAQKKASDVKDTAKEEAKNVKQEAGKQAKKKSTQ